MDLLGYLALGALLFVGVLVVIGSVILTLVRHRNTFRHWGRPDLAGALGLQQAGTNWYSGTRAGLQVQFGYSLVRQVAGWQGASYPLWAEVQIAPPVRVPLDVRLRNGPEGMPIGWPEFDARHVVVSPDIGRARLLLPPEVMQQFLVLASQGGVALSCDRVRFTTDQSWNDPARLAWLLDSMIALSRQLSARGAAL